MRRKLFALMSIVSALLLFGRVEAQEQSPSPSFGQLGGDGRAFAFRDYEPNAPEPLSYIAPPEPSTFALLGVGICCIVVIRRHKRIERCFVPALLLSVASTAGAGILNPDFSEGADGLEHWGVRKEYAHGPMAGRLSVTTGGDAVRVAVSDGNIVHLQQTFNSKAGDAIRVTTLGLLDHLIAGTTRAYVGQYVDGLYSNHLIYSPSTGAIPLAYEISGSYTFQHDGTAVLNLSTISRDGGFIEALTMISYQLAPIPEPATAGLSLLGFCVAIGTRRRRR